MEEEGLDAGEGEERGLTEEEREGEGDGVEDERAVGEGETAEEEEGEGLDVKILPVDCAVGILEVNMLPETVGVRGEEGEREGRGVKDSETDDVLEREEEGESETRELGDTGGEKVSVMSGVLLRVPTIAPRAPRRLGESVTLTVRLGLRERTGVGLTEGERVPGALLEEGECD